MKRAFLLVGLALALGLPADEALAQTGTARGKVVDEKGEPVPDAQITIEFIGDVPRSHETKTNKRGEFTQVGLYPGEYRVTAAKEGYQGAYIESRISLGEPTYLPEFQLRSRQAVAAAASAEADQTATEVKAAFAKAVGAIEGSRLDEAKLTLQELIAKHPEIPEAHYNLGFVLSKQQQWAEAEAAFQKALELRADYGDAKVALAKVYQDSGQQQKAMELLSAAENEDDPKVQFNLGVNYLNAGDSEKAFQHFQRAKELDAKNPEVYFHLGTLAVGRNDVPTAVAELEQYLSMNPTNAQNVATAKGLLGYLKPK